MKSLTGLSRSVVKIMMKLFKSCLICAGSATLKNTVGLDNQSMGRLLQNVILPQREELSNKSKFKKYLAEAKDDIDRIIESLLVDIPKLEI